MQPVNVIDTLNYHEALDQLQAAAQQKLANGAGALFVTQCRKKLMDHYLKSIKKVAESVYPDNVAEIYKYYHCSQCARFMSRVGHLVVEEGGGLRSIFWDPSAVTDPFFKEVVALMKVYVEQSRIVTLYNPDGPYSTYKNVTQDDQGNTWNHFFIQQQFLRHRYAGLDREIKFDDVAKQMDRMQALIKIATTEVDLPTVMWIEQMFQARQIEHLENSEEALKAFGNLLSQLQVIQAMTHYQSANEYARETMLVNAIWCYAMRHKSVITLRKSLLGSLLLEAAKAMRNGQQTKAKEHGLISYWKAQSDTQKFRRTTAPASTGQLEKTANFLQENNWLPSLQQREAAEKDVPALWEAQDRWAPIKGQEISTQNGFSEFAARKGVETDPIKAPIKMDLGYFFNEVLMHVTALGMDMTDLHWKPALLNTMVDLEAKPIFKWDSEERRAPFIPWSYVDNFRALQIISDPSVKQNGRIILPVLSVTSSDTVGYHLRDHAQIQIMFLFHGITMPYAPHPALFAEACKGELYEHRRAIEDYSKSTQIPRAEGQQAIGITVNERHPQQQQEVGITLHARLNETGQAMFGAADIRFVIDGTGYKIRPDTSKYEVKRNRSALPETPAEAPAPVPSASSTLLV